MKSDWVPMRWPRQWEDPSKLDLIKGTPINCLVGETAPPFPLGDIGFVPLREDAPPEGVTLREGVWPDVESARDRERDAADAGPTGAPWVDSNSWVIRLAQALEPDQMVWLTYGPPEKPDVVSPDSFALPVAEAEAYGARWVISLDSEFQAGLEAGSDAALGAWKKIISALELSARHREWKGWEPVAALAVVSDFTGDNEFLGGEFLNLAPRNHLAHRIIERSRGGEASLKELKAVLYIATEPPEGELRRKLLAFVNDGGLLISPAGFPESPPAETRHGYDIHRHGNGSIATPKEEWADPYVLAGEVHLLLSHREDVVRIWNGGAINLHYTASRDGNKAVVHLVDYSRRRRLDAVTLGFARPFSSARVFTLESSKNVEPIKRRLGTEIPLPPFSTYAAVELRT